MQADEEIKKELVNNLREWLGEFVREAEKLIDSIERAETVERIMELERDLRVAWIDYMPTGSDHCYFCLGYPCCECKYAEFHGVCTIDKQEDLLRELWRCIERVKTNDYGAIKVVQGLLMKMIKELYYSGEEY